jgi:hypothetical protein
MSRSGCFLILGGAGLVGKQIAREIADELTPAKIIIASLLRDEVERTLAELKGVCNANSTEWVGVWGNIFVRADYADEPRHKLLESHTLREDLFADLFGGIDDAYETSLLVQIIREHKPDVIVDSINTATAISYQDKYTASVVAKARMDELVKAVEAGNRAMFEELDLALDVLLLSQSLPQLVRHTQLLHRAMREVGTRLYLKIGTTGTGGMGLNIPYTHSEDKPSAKLMTKTAVAFAHTGLMFLMARTPNGPIVKEIKPGGMIGYADVTRRTIREQGQSTYIYTNRTETLSDSLTLYENGNRYQKLEELQLPVIDTGENGLFTKGEFEAITALHQMEFITPEEIAAEAVLEIRGSNTGFDVIAAIDSSVMNPTYRAGYLRQQVLDEIQRLEHETETHSVALGQLGPPELSKLLWEAELLKIEYGTLSGVLAQTPEQISDQLYDHIRWDRNMAQTITSLGIPILLPDGKRLMRGPRIRIPEVPNGESVALNNGDVDTYAAKGWLDLRPSNMTGWQKRFETIRQERERIRGRGSAAITRQSYLFDDIRIGEIVGWIFNNEQDGYRIK